MREIKFRAWDSNEGRMWSHAEIDASDKDGIVMWGEIFNKKEGGFAVMQFTGLKDKNGVEIYEGDVVSDRILSRKFNVFWRSTAMGTGFNIDWDIPADRYEVIGNIHQNPELLEAK